MNKNTTKNPESDANNTEKSSIWSFLQDLAEKSGWDGGKKLFSGNFSESSAYILDLLKSLKPVIVFTMNFFKRIWQELKELFSKKDGLSKTMADLKNVVVEEAHKMEESSSNLAKKAGGMMKSAVSVAENAAEKAKEGLAKAKDMVEDGIEHAKEAVEDKVDDVKETVAKKADDLKEKAENVVDNAQNMAKEKMADAKDAITGDESEKKA